MPPHEPLLRARSLTLGYGGRAVLKDVELEVRSGEFWFLVGENGAGKTTLLRAVLGELRPMAGELWTHPSLHDRTRLGFVPQYCVINPALPTTVREFVSLGTVGLRLDSGERESHLAWALEQTGLASLRAESYWVLSGGQRQRALVARALVRRPRLLVLDEPTSHLDFSIERSLLELLGRLNREEGLTVFFVTHDLHLARHYGSHVALFDSGKVQSGLSAEVLSDENVERVYGMSLDNRE